MQTLYTAADPVEAEILRGYLAAHGIEARVLGASLWGARGELPVNDYPRLVLCDGRDDARARNLLQQYERRRHAQALWRCACGEESPVTFETCWACGVERVR
ncbi:DUF2007 domain-containing protein [Fontimonas sp. SYSU GA230001]|uniref:putative signal transducing protein n=1 Tax=Fontimonas sp. SYSU GA230001 TaxID=3142450 RepID=UPI0032B5BFC0